MELVEVRALLLTGVAEEAYVSCNPKVPAGCEGEIHGLKKS
jgi:hypothetical protein